MYVVLFFVLLLSVLGVDAEEEDVRRNDEVVARLREELAEEGVEPLPEPPRELGVHAACVRHGVGCPDEYVEFLESLQRTPHTFPETKPRNDAMSAERSGNMRRQTPLHGAGERRAYSIKGEDAVIEVQLENMRRLRDVMRERLAKQQSPEQQWKCKEFLWISRGLKMVEAMHSVLLQKYWNFVMNQLLPCVLLVFVTVWVFTGNRIPREHLRSLLADDPVPVFNEVIIRRKSPQSVAQLVMERESHNFSSMVDIDDGSSSPSAVPNGFAKEKEDSMRAIINYRRDRWFATRFALLEAYHEAHIAGVVLRLRLALSAAVLLMLCWTLFSLVLRASEVRRNSDGGIIQHLLVMLFPSWVTTSFVLYIGWSWIGGMVAYAAWELVSTGEALVRTGERAAALHEKILERWCG
ncbi:hypothetical protein C3747_47g265 [Trypanosoma cruzi]|uniref:Uncharacterized protein n=2 Tax=Trypanosoma cruzi TaxID=5693 RepID=Q4DKL3_TRYCC|nr:hypothetical protein, conserved [Trypanosoma cruzi]EAN93052.1 hypothetical protein, conserved [Trypanosoma cruzi]PWV12855.1 hypothetical protein C3747_47g265 [Trypanosoma cruzi]RNC44124.1 hypothetical protein TcCL_NonESM06143 [Trypanosoma cruzi]|eukprot:XP_814903.1 hypothetical protein [Trypanosoma cruzi strain CL Brener]